MGASPFLGGSFLKTLLLRVFFYSADFFFISFLLISTCFTVSYRVRLFLASSLGGLKLSSLFSPGEGAAGVVYPMLALGSGAILGGAFFFRRMWLLQPVSTQGSIKSAFLGSFFFTYSVDRGYVEFIGPQGLGYFGSFLRRSFTLIEKKIVYIRVGLLFFFVFFFI